jgi:hypothetical protein
VFSEESLVRGLLGLSRGKGRIEEVGVLEGEDTPPPRTRGSALSGVDGSGIRRLIAGGDFVADCKGDCCARGDFGLRVSATPPLFAFVPCALDGGEG